MAKPKCNCTGLNTETAHSLKLCTNLPGHKLLSVPITFSPQVNSLELEKKTCFFSARRSSVSMRQNWQPNRKALSVNHHVICTMLSILDKLLKDYVYPIKLY